MPSTRPQRIEIVLDRDGQDLRRWERVSERAISNSEINNDA
jgi:hypothetical protein